MKTEQIPETVNENPSIEETTSNVVIEPHHLVFAYCERCFGAALKSALHDKPVEQRTKFFRKLARGKTLIVERPFLLAYLDSISLNMKKLLERHSPYFWLFLYRRIKPVLSPLHDNVTDATTLLLVRQIADLAIAKYGSLDIIDIVESSRLGFEARWGGYLKLAIDDMFSPSGRNEARALFEGKTSELLTTTFRPGDLKDVYGIEGLAYEYWLCTARLRSVGKGKKLLFEPKTSEFMYVNNPVLDEAIARFDARNNEVEFFPTLVGVVTPDSKEDRVFQLFGANYNVGNADLSEFFKPFGLNFASPDGQNLYNFAPEFLAIDRFLEVHKYLDEPFRAATGVGLEEFLFILWAVGNLALAPDESVISGLEDFGLRIFQLLRRGYAVYRAKATELAPLIDARLQNYPGLTAEKRAAIQAVLPKAVERITLSREQQEKISPWSAGPRPIIVPCGDFTIIDAVSTLAFVIRMFTGVRDDGQARGLIFEDTVRTSITKLFEQKGFLRGPRKIYEDGKVIDEIDLMLRKNSRVFVCECFSMWLPLNFEIGDENTLAMRAEKIDEKIKQAEDTCNYLRNHRIGLNYDFTDVMEFVPIVVGPFVEWLPNASPKYWISKAHPRVMTVDELVTYLDAQT